jgi:hypothetical protein
MGRDLPQFAAVRRAHRFLSVFTGEPQGDPSAAVWNGVMALTETESEGGDTKVIHLPEGNVAWIIELPLLGPPDAA